MENEQIMMLDILLETHLGLERQGPGSADATLRALGFIDAPESITRAADLGCGTGGQTMVLAKNISGSIVGLDQFSGFIDVLNDNAERKNLGDRVRGIVGSMENLAFERESLDLIWSEGAIDSIGFESGLTHWNGFLKSGGFIAVTCPTWLTAERPNELESFWADAGCELDTVARNIEIMQSCGYGFIAAFVLTDECWTDNYFTPRNAAERLFSEKHPANKTVAEYIKSSRYETELFAKYKQHYGYVFYIGRKQ